MIYFVEDDPSIRELVVYTLSNVGLEAKGFEKPSAFRAAVAKKLPSLVLLDIMLPEESGLELLKDLRNTPATKHLPIMMITAKGSEYDKALGLDTGADDYLVKPFGMMELIARVKALLRRTRSENGAEMEYQVGGLYLNPTRHLVKADGETVNLTYKEYALLSLLMENQGIVFTRDRILDQVWGYQFDGESRTVDVHIRSLRRKLGACGQLIETVRGIGYKIGESEL